MSDGGTARDSRSPAAEDHGPDGELQETSVSQLVEEVKRTRRYAFLIGAGTSRLAPAGIETASELISKWQLACYRREASERSADWREWERRRDIDEDQAELTREASEAWAADVESKNGVGEDTRYGFWFSRRYPMRSQRRREISALVAGAKTTPAHIVLALLMGGGGTRSGVGGADRRRYVPFTLTPNFDDLLFDAFYLFLDEKPRLIDHRTVAPEFTLIGDRPTIVKLHGDYLYDNLQNTGKETESLERALENVVEQTVSEYGLVVVGYSGNDESIMSTLRGADLSEYGIFWCVRNESGLSDKASALLREQPNTRLVTIDGFEELLFRLYGEVGDLELPTPEHVVERAEERATVLTDVMRERMKKASSEVRAHLRDWSLQFEDHEELTKPEYQRRVEEATQALDRDQEDVSALVDRGAALYGLAQYEDALADFTKAIDIDPDYARAYYKRGLTKGEFGAHEERTGADEQVVDRYRDAIGDFTTALDCNPEYVAAYTSRGFTRFRLGRFTQAVGDNDGARAQFTAAIEDFTAALDRDPDYVQAYYLRGVTKDRVDELEAAVDDFDQAIDRGLETAEVYQHRAQTEIRLGDFHHARRDAVEAKRLSESDDERAVSLLLALVAAAVLGAVSSDEEAEYRALCEQEFEVAWTLDPLDTWLGSAGLAAERVETIRVLIDQLRPHLAAPPPDGTPA